jgi:hypothetical protein
MFYKKNIANFILLLFGTFFLSSMTYSSDFHSARTDGLGGAGHASPLLNDSIYLNPSFAPYIQAHSISFNYLAYGDGITNSPYGYIPYYGHDINLSVVDGTVESLFQAGVSYTVRDDSSLIHLIAAKKIIQRLSLGIGGKFIFPQNQPGNHPFEATASATGIIAQWFQASLIVDNLLQSATNLGFRREFILGTKFNAMNIVLAYFDPHIFDDMTLSSTFGFESGAEFPFFTDFFLRIGAFHNSTIPYQAQVGDGYGIGVGWIAPKISFEYAFSRAYSPVSALSHNFGVSVYF